MPKSIATALAEMSKDIEYLKIEMQDVKRLEYWLLGLFVSLFVALTVAFVGLVVNR